MKIIENNSQEVLCNIDKSEIQKRESVGRISLAGAILVFILLLLNEFFRWNRSSPFLIAVFGVMLFSSFLGFLQAHNRFCVYFAVANKQSEGLGNKGVTNITKLRLLYGLKLVSQALGLSIVSSILLSILLAYII